MIITILGMFCGDILVDIETMKCWKVPGMKYSGVCWAMIEVRGDSTTPSATPIRSFPLKNPDYLSKYIKNRVSFSFNTNNF